MVLWGIKRVGPGGPAGSPSELWEWIEEDRQLERDFMQNSPKDIYPVLRQSVNLRESKTPSSPPHLNQAFFSARAYVCTSND